MAKFIYNMVETAAPGTLDPNAANPFTDVADDGPFEDFISALADAGIVDGTSDTTYSPGDDVTRGEMAKFIANAIEAVLGTDFVDADATEPFTDVADDGPLQDFIATLYQADVVEGETATTYNPGGNVDRGTMAVFVMRGAEYLQNNDAWAPVRQSNQTFTVTPVGRPDEQR